MKTIIASALVLCGMGLFAETLVAHWDFSKGINPLKDSIRMNIRGKSAIAKEGKDVFLRINGDGKTAAGIITKGIHKKLTPASFRAEVTFRLGKGFSPSTNQFLLDSKYVPYPHKQAVHNKGFILYLARATRTSAEKYYPVATIGFGTTSLSLTGKLFTLPAGKKCTLSFSWNGKDTAEFKVDGVVNSTHKNVKNGAPVAPAHYPMCIGDRYSGDFSPVNGDIFEVKVFDLTAAKK